MLLRFTQIFIRPKVLFIRGNYRVTLSCCIILSVKICGIRGKKCNFVYVELTLIRESVIYKSQFYNAELCE